MIDLRSLSLGLVVALTAIVLPILAAEPAAPVRVGILGLDNYQGLAYAELFNNPQAEGDLAGVQVVAA